MSNHFSPEADDQMPEKKKSQNRLLLLLLLLVALFAYLYFFTGLIKPREEQTAQAPAPEAAPTDVVKQPLPPRPEAGAQPGAAAGEPAADAKGGEAPAQPETAPAKPGAPAAPAAAPEGAKAGKPAAAPESAAKAGKPAAAPEAAKAGKPATAAPPEAKPAKPAASQAAQKPATPPSKPAAKPAAEAKATSGKPAASAAAKDAKAAAAAKDAKTAAAAKDAKTAAAEKTAQGANGARKGGAADRGKGVAAKAVPATAAGAYTVEIDDLPQAEIKSVTAKLKQAGIAPVVTARSQKSEPVHRLYLADFGNRQEALEELERLKLAAPNAFMLKESGRYTVYAGSFVREERASVERDRLYAKGVQLLVKSGTATVPVVKLRAGSFATKANAEKATQSLKQKGISAKVVKVAR